MKPNIFIPLFCLVLCTFSCKEDDEPKTAPPITQENTFSCKINGELFVPEDHYHGFNPDFGIGAGILPDNSWNFRLENKQIYIYIYIV